MAKELSNPGASWENKIGARRPVVARAVADFIRQRADAILHDWEARVSAELREVALTGLALRDDLPGLLSCLAAWLPTNEPPDGSALATSALGHALERLDAGLSLAQLMREYRLLRECILEAVLGAEQIEQDRAGPTGHDERIARVVELARLNAGLDVALASSVERFVEERDRRAGEAVRASEALSAFLLELSDRLRPLTDPAAIQGTVTRMGRQHFGADRCYYCEVEGDAAIIRQDDARPGQPSVAGAYPLGDMPLFRAAIDAGRPLVVEDAHTSPALDDDLRRLCLELQIVSFVDVPIIKEGRAAGVLCITHAAPRAWTASEIALATETAERTWAALEHARALAALREANERLVEADRHKNEFLAVLSHELRNPLAPIRSGVFLLEHAPPGDEKAVRARQVIDRQVQHMTRLIEDLLDVTRISRGKIALQRQRVDLNAVVSTAAEDHRDLFARTCIELEVAEAGRAVWVDGDRTRLAQVFGNLLTNAAKFTPRGGKTALTVEEREGRAVVRVRDTGVGMTPETQACLFQPFVQAAQTIERSRGGLGLGLALVKGLVELHGGTVSVHSAGEGKGSEFVITLPSREPERPAVGTAEHPASPPLGRVLVVEDNVDAAETLREVLMLLGHDVTVAYSGPDGLAAARARKPAVILCDIGLPGLDGYAIARAIRADADAELRGTFLVALSGYALPEDVTKSKEAGFDRHMAKPPNIAVLEALLRAGAGRDQASSLVK